MIDSQLMRLIKMMSPTISIQLCSVVTQQCCYDDNGTLLADPRVARISIGTPLYHNMATMAAYYGNTILPFLYCCKEGIPTGETRCSDYQSTLPVNNGAVGRIDYGRNKRSSDTQLEISQLKSRIRRFYDVNVLSVSVNVIGNKITIGDNSKLCE